MVIQAGWHFSQPLLGLRLSSWNPYVGLSGPSNALAGTFTMWVKACLFLPLGLYLYSFSSVGWTRCFLSPDLHGLWESLPTTNSFFSSGQTDRLLPSNTSSCCHSDLCGACAYLPLALQIMYLKSVGGLSPTSSCVTSLVCAQCNVSSCSRLAWGQGICRQAIIISFRLIASVQLVVDSLLYSSCCQSADTSKNIAIYIQVIYILSTINAKLKWCTLYLIFLEIRS